MQTNAALTEEVEKSLSKDEPNSNGDCPLTPLLGLLATKWTTRIVFHLHRAAQPLRYGQLRRLVGSVTQKELTKRLRELERQGIVERRVYPEIPPRVEYNLSPRGASLAAPLKTLLQWAEENR